MTTGSEQQPQWWLWAPGRGGSHWEECRKKGIAAIGWDHIGDLRHYPDHPSILAALGKYTTEKLPIMGALACYQWSAEEPTARETAIMRVGDVIVARVGQSKVVGLGIVRSDYRYDESRAELRHVRDVDWRTSFGLHEARPTGITFPVKTLTNISGNAAHQKTIKKALEGQNGGGSILNRPRPELFLASSRTQQLLELLQEKRNLILQGPPGTGKTFTARALAERLHRNQSQPDGCFEIVQFHQSYGYEDFVRGFRPTAEGGFRLEDGPFLRLCERARESPDNPHVLLIDEINRGNVSRILGELLMLIESDKRGPDWAVLLSHSGDSEEPFWVPKNVYLIGAMNTADRSLALVDYALRRRFVFETLTPAFEVTSFARFLQRNRVPENIVTRIRRRVGALNDTIRKDTTLGKGFEIGHSYFCNLPRNPDQADWLQWYERIIEFEIRPLLEEYWFDRSERADEEVRKLLAKG